MLSFQQCELQENQDAQTGGTLGGFQPKLGFAACKSHPCGHSHHTILVLPQVLEDGSVNEREMDKVPSVLAGPRAG